ncbi:tyrosine--tRNA ligase [Cephaloticoccus primus]|uniref:Tyrosine--tRNA ligase n=1 Tax=Cephaloticoccus primus TaxID=1548207 RepID=A0A139SMX9_9BACT|nr:tyrosine--tRNA ligase [Cephaloticoccus primus]KXU35918.1 tyrosine--tRNA ligase [Cephaloticoccus primus]
MNLIEDLQWRGLLADCTDLPALDTRLKTGQPITLYCGFDPTGDSLHVGHLMGQLTLRRFQLAGHHPLALAGGATGMVGDPSGKSAERNLLSPEALAHNLGCIKQQLARLLDFDSPTNPARLVDNATWTTPISFLDFLREVGKHFSLNAMIAKESVRARMEGEHGISYTEFSYQLLQAHDFYHLRHAHDCELQIGGSDQWGNITAGTDLIRKKLGTHAWGWTFPLITKADGTKFGKTAGGAVWLDPQKTSPYKFYQFFINTEDAKVCEYLRKFTFLPREEIEALEAAHAANPGAREAHKALAREVTALVHGPAAVEAAIKASAILFGAEIGDTSEETFRDVVGEVPTTHLAKTALEAPARSGGGTASDTAGATAPIAATAEKTSGAPLIELLVHSGLCSSKGQARKDISGGGIYLNNRRETDPTRHVTPADLLFGKHLLLRKGKRSYAVLTAE